MHFSRSTFATLVALLPAYTLAQTFTDCDATKESCKPDPGLSSSHFLADFTTGKSSGASWSEADGTTIKYGGDGAEYTILGPGEAPTVSSDFAIFYGKVEVVMKAAHGTGIVSSIVLESGVLDEIDWEFLGSTPTQVQTNYYGLANTTTYDRVAYHNVADTQTSFHTYTIDWTPSQIEFLVDGTSVRTITRASTQGTRNFPQTPMYVKLGNWAAGGPGMAEGTVAWGGGETDFEEGPFEMVVKSVEIWNYNPACSYTYGDRSGSDDSIEVVKSGESCGSGEVVAESKPSSSSSGVSSSSKSTLASSSTSSASTSSASTSSASATVQSIPSSTPSETPSSTASTASETATQIPTLTKTVANIVPTAYINSTALASTTLGTSTTTLATAAVSTSVQNSTSTTTTTGTGASLQTAESYTGGAAGMYSVGPFVGLMGVVVVVAGVCGL